jgi:hypothetical protein
MTYLAERYRPGVSEPEVAAALDRLDPAEVRWLDATLVSTDELPSERIVEGLCARSQLDPSSALVSKGDL